MKIKENKLCLVPLERRGRAMVIDGRDGFSVSNDFQMETIVFSIYYLCIHYIITHCYVDVLAYLSGILLCVVIGLIKYIFLLIMFSLSETKQNEMK